MHVCVYGNITTYITRLKWLLITLVFLPIFLKTVFTHTHLLYRNEKQDNENTFSKCERSKIFLSNTWKHSKRVLMLCNVWLATS